MIVKLKNEIILFSILVFLSSFSTNSFGQEKLTKEKVENKTIKAIKSGDTDELHKLFSKNLRLSILDEEKIISKSHAKVLLAEFFKKNTPEKFIIKHQGSSKDKAHFTLGKLHCGGKIYRASFLVKNKDGEFKIIQLEFQIE